MENEVMWAAGLFEGEGCLAYSAGRPRLSLKMIHEESVRRFHAAMMDMGDVYGPYGPYKSQLGNKPHFVWVAQRKEDVERCVELLRPHLTDWAKARLDRSASEPIADVVVAPAKPKRRRPPEGADPDFWLDPERSKHLM